MLRNVEQELYITKKDVSSSLNPLESNLLKILLNLTKFFRLN